MSVATDYRSLKVRPVAGRPGFVCVLLTLPGGYDEVELVLRHSEVVALRALLGSAMVGGVE
jgi:hypothetical protein